MQEVPNSRRKIVQDKQMEGTDQSITIRRDRSDNISLSQRSDRQTFRISQDIRKDKAPVPLAEDARRDKTVHRVMSHLPDVRQAKKKQRAQPYPTNRTMGKSRN